MQPFIALAGNGCSARQEFPALFSERHTTQSPKNPNERYARAAAARVAEEEAARQTAKVVAINRHGQDSTVGNRPLWTRNNDYYVPASSNTQRVSVTIEGRRTTLHVTLAPGEKGFNEVVSGRVTNEALGRSSVKKCTYNGETVYIDVRRN